MQGFDCLIRFEIHGAKIEKEDGAKNMEHRLNTIKTVHFSEFLSIFVP